MNREIPRSTGTEKATSQDYGGRFAPTSWTAVVATRQPNTPQAEEALSRLCEAYWQPLHDYVRRLGHGEQDAKDLTQEFFLRLLSKNIFAAADREKGRFRTFLLSSLNHFLTNEWHRAKAAKRGGGKVIVSLDEKAAEGQPSHEPVTLLSPEAVYEKSWATSVLRQANERLRDEYSAAGKQTLFDQLAVFLETSPDPRGYHAVAAQLRMTPNAVGVAVHRMRQRLRELIRAEVERTLAQPTAAEIDAEMKFLLESLGR